MGNFFANKLKNGYLASAVAVGLVSLLASQVIAQSADPISTKYIAKDSFMVIAVHPSKIIECADQKSETTTYVLDSMKKFAGLDVKKMEQIVIQMGTSKEEINDPGDVLSITFRFSGKIDQEAVVEKMGANFDLEKGDLDGKTIYRPSGDDDPCMYFPDDNTMIMALEKRINAVQDSSGMGNGSQIAKKIMTSDHVGISFALSDDEDQKAVMEQIMDELPLSELGIDAEMMDNCSSGDMHINLKSDTFFSGTLNCKNSETAEEVVEKSMEAVEQMKASLEQAEGELDSAPPEMAEVAEQILELAFKAIENTEVKANGSKVTMKVEVEGGMSKLVDGVAKGIEQTFRMLEQFGGGF